MTGMKTSGPLLTLLGGVALAALLFALDVRATDSGRPAAAAATRASAAPAPAASRRPAAAPSRPAPTRAPQKLNRGTYAGYTNGAGALLGIAVHDGLAVAYLCDGKRVEAWLRGTAAGGKLVLNGRDASITAGYSGTRATGVISVGGQRWTFTLHLVHAPSGLYRATAEVRGARVEASWVVADGRQLGVRTTDGAAAQPAPELDPTTGRVDLGTGPVTATHVDGETGSGF
jgi:hypothetical protein